MEMSKKETGKSKEKINLAENKEGRNNRRKRLKYIRLQKNYHIKH